MERIDSAAADTSTIAVVEDDRAPSHRHRAAERDPGDDTVDPSDTIVISSVPATSSSCHVITCRVITCRVIRVRGDRQRTREVAKDQLG